jgi:hypothetical protein
MHTSIVGEVKYLRELKVVREGDKNGRDGPARQTLTLTLTLTLNPNP